MKELYEAPEVQVIELEAQGMIAASRGDTYGDPINLNKD